MASIGGTVRQPGKLRCLGKGLRLLRCGKGLSQTQFADLLDTTRKMIDYYERRAGNLSLDFIQRAAEALDVSVAELRGSKPHTMRAKPGPVS